MMRRRDKVPMGNGLLGEAHAAALADFRVLDPTLKRTVMAHVVEIMSVTDDVEMMEAYLRMTCHAEKMRRGKLLAPS
jgi:hypothetical protein